MRILVATDQWSPDVVGGSARVAADTARTLARRGHDVVVLAPAQPGMSAVEDELGVEVRRVIRRGGFPQTFADPVLTRRHARKLRERSFDLAVAHQATNAVGLAEARLGIPLAVVFHASVVLEMRFHRRRVRGMQRAAALALDPALVALERKAIGSATGILVLSRFSAELVSARHSGASGRVHLVGGAVEERFFAAAPEPQECRQRLGIPSGVLLLTARRLEPRMGIDLLIEALARLDDRVVLAIAGDGSMREALARKTDELGLGDRVRLLGRVTDEDLRSLYAAADLFVLPTTAYEGFGMSTVEALAAGTPVLGTAVGATPEIVGELGDEFVVKTADPTALALAIGQVLPLLGADLRIRARTLAEHRYRWETAIIRWEQALSAVARA